MVCGSLMHLGPTYLSPLSLVHSYLAQTSAIRMMEKAQVRASLCAKSPLLQLSILSPSPLRSSGASLCHGASPAPGEGVSD